jgi:predicted transporter
MESKSTFRREFELIIVGAIIFIASFLWKDIFIDYRDDWFPRKNGMLGILFTIIVTLLLIVIAIRLKTKWDADAESKNRKIVAATQVIG